MTLLHFQVSCDNKLLLTTADMFYLLSKTFDRLTGLELVNNEILHQQLTSSAVAKMLQNDPAVSTSGGQISRPSDQSSIRTVKCAVLLGAAIGGMSVRYTSNVQSIVFDGSLQMSYAAYKHLFIGHPRTKTPNAMWIVRRNTFPDCRSLLYCY